MPKPRPDLSSRQRQQGFLILALLLIIVLAGSSFVLAGLNTRQAAFLEQQRELHQRMEQAKANLLAFAVNSAAFYGDARGPGFFPCPDSDNDGIADATCNPDGTVLAECSTTLVTPLPLLGRLPQYVEQAGSRMSFSDYNAGIDQQFWYAVAPGYVYNTTTSAARSAQYRTSVDPAATAPTPACMRLRLNEIPGYVALIIAPGEALDTQDRLSNRMLYSNYLDGQNGADTFHYFSSYNSNQSAYNDQVIGITFTEYYRLVATKAATVLKRRLDAYHASNGAYPADQPSFEAVFSTVTDPVWLQPTAASGSNGEAWSSYTTYVKTSDDQAVIRFAGCPNILYTLNYAPIASITRTGATCT